MDIAAAASVFTDPRAYADDARFHAAAALLRRESPVHLVEHEKFHPFYAITKHEDVMSISRASDIWLNAPARRSAPSRRTRIGRTSRSAPWSRWTTRTTRSTAT
ncbi:hypothetical protein FrEUN1fDRAFT_0465 [Parafrankia sp. EUN1f]|nr:hypothetical protein [Parafrankia sp. EUN1f]EFC86364.1 hypothetical protein FrEUN1fDRAFT_0465 [Parafrankia sp. EUN1f]